MCMIFTEIYNDGGKYYYIKNNTMLPLESATVNKLANINKYIPEGYKLYIINGQKVLTKKILNLT